MISTKAGLLVKLCAAAACSVGLAGLAALVLLVLLLGLDLLPERTALLSPWPWLPNVGWLMLFGVQHSGMARAGFKLWWTRWIPSELERAVYVAVSGLLALGMALTWQPLPGEPLWRLPLWVAGIGVVGGLAAGLVSTGCDPLRFIGLRQVWEQGQSPTPDELRTSGPYHYVRHPQMSCTLVFLWAQPVMSPALALLSGGLTLYVLLALPLEERDLRRQFGAAYEEYRRRVPALVPWKIF
jgi:protein-S-isoprenylcysteine O-methyltransferase Ste14